MELSLQNIVEISFFCNLRLLRYSFKRDVMNVFCFKEAAWAPKYCVVIACLEGPIVSWDERMGPTSKALSPKVKEKIFTKLTFEWDRNRQYMNACFAAAHIRSYNLIRKYLSRTRSMTKLQPTLSTLSTRYVLNGAQRRVLLNKRGWLKAAVVFLASKTLLLIWAPTTKRVVEIGNGEDPCAFK